MHFLVKQIILLQVLVTSVLSDSLLLILLMTQIRFSLTKDVLSVEDFRISLGPGEFVLLGSMVVQHCSLAVGRYWIWSRAGALLLGVHMLSPPAGVGFLWLQSLPTVQEQSC